MTTAKQTNELIELKLSKAIIIAYKISFMQFKRTFIVLAVVAMLSTFGTPLLFQVSSAQSSFSVRFIGTTETSISVEWTEENVFASNGYVLYYSPYGANGPYQNISGFAPTQTDYAIPNLSPNSNYWIYIYTSWGGFTPNSEVTNTIEVSTAQNIALGVEANSVTQTTISLVWSDYNDYSNLTAFQSYTIQMRPASGFYSTLATLNSESDSSYAVTGLSPGTSYSFQVYDTVYISGSGAVSSYSNEVSVTTNAPPINAVISSSVGSMSVGQSAQFSTTVSGGISPYSYQWYVNGNPISGANSPTYTFDPSSSGSYSVYVTVTDSLGTSKNSNTVPISVTNSTANNNSANNNGSSTILGSTIPIIAVVAIIAIIGIAVALVLRSKRTKT